MNKPKASELNPTAELRNWRYFPNAQTIIGTINGQYVAIGGIVQINRYSDHNFFINKLGEYYKAYQIHKRMNGG